MSKGTVLLEEEVARLIHRIAESYPGTPNLSKMIGLYANDVLCRVTLGRDFSGGGREYDRHGFQKMLDDFQALLGGFSLGDYFPSMEFVHSNWNEIETSAHLQTV